MNRRRRRSTRHGLPYYTGCFWNNIGSSTNTDESKGSKGIATLAQGSTDAKISHSDALSLITNNTSVFVAYHSERSLCRAAGRNMTGWKRVGNGRRSGIPAVRSTSCPTPWAGWLAARRSHGHLPLQGHLDPGFRASQRTKMV